MVRLKHKTAGYTRDFIDFMAVDDGKNTYAPYGLTYDTSDNQWHWYALSNYEPIKNEEVKEIEW